MEERQEITGPGAFAKRNWLEIQKSGTAAPSPVDIAQFLEGGGQMARLSREELSSRICGYFSECIERYEDEETGNNGYRWRKNPTKSGLARSIGVTLDTLCRYVRGEYSAGLPYNAEMPGNHTVVHPDDFDIIRASYTVIEEYYEGQLALNKNNAGTIFWLKNSGNTRWSDTQELEVRTQNYQTPQLTMQELTKLREQMGQRYAGCMDVEGEMELLEIPEKPEI